VLSYQPVGGAKQVIPERFLRPAGWSVRISTGCRKAIPSSMPSSTPDSANAQRIDAGVKFPAATGDFAGVPGLDNQVFVVWEGQVFIPTAGEVVFSTEISSDNAQYDVSGLRIDNAFIAWGAGRSLAPRSRSAQAGTIWAWPTIILGRHLRAARLRHHLAVSTAGKPEVVIPCSALRPPLDAAGLARLTDLEVLSLRSNQLRGVAPLAG